MVLWGDNPPKSVEEIDARLVEWRKEKHKETEVAFLADEIDQEEMTARVFYAELNSERMRVVMIAALGQEPR